MKTILILCGTIISLVWISGCGWSTLWYENSPDEIRYENGKIGLSVWWAEIDSQSGKCTAINNHQRSQEPLDTLIIFSVVFVPYDTLQDPQDLRKSIGIEHIWLTINNGNPIKVPKCEDTAFIAEKRVHQYPLRIFRFGPLSPSWPLPERFVGSFDLIFRDPTTGDEIKREHVQFVAKKKTKSLLRDFLDGR